MEFDLFLPALLTGIFCYLGAIESPWLFGMTGGFFTTGRPLVAGLLVGLAFGDIQTGILCGAAVQAVFIANLSTGGATNSEITYAAYGGIGLALATTGEPALAVTLALLIGQTFGLIFYSTRNILYSFWNHRADEAAENNDTNGIFLNHVVYPQICTFLFRALPTFIVIFFGSTFVDWLFESIPQVLTDTITVLGGVLPALGIAMLMNIVIKENKLLIFFLCGFVLTSFTQMSMIVLVFIAAVVAYLVYLATTNNNDAPALATANANAYSNDDIYEDEDLF